MKLQSLSEFALNNNEMDATKGGKRVTMTAAQLALLQTAIGGSTGTAKVGGTGAKVAATNCSATKTTMVGNICIEWKNGVPCATNTTPTN